MASTPETNPGLNEAEARRILEARLANEPEPATEPQAEEHLPENETGEPINSEVLAAEVAHDLENNPNVPEEVREQLAEHHEEVEQTIKHNVNKWRDFLYGTAAGVTTKVVGTYLLKKLGARALDLTVPGLGIAVSAAAGGVVGGAYEGVRAFRKETKLANSVEEAQKRLTELEKLEPIERVKTYIAIQAALDERKYTGNSENLQNTLDAIDVEQMVRNVEWEKIKEEPIKRLQTLVNIRDGAQRESLLKDQANKQILEQIQKEHAKGKRNKSRIAIQALKGAAIGAVGGAVGGTLALGLEHWLGWGAQAASGAADTLDTSKKAASTVTKEVATTKADIVEKMHKHVWGTIKQWYIDHGVPKEKITNKLLDKGVKVITENNPAADLPGVPPEQLNNLIHVQGWHTVKGLAYHYVDRKMQEGVPLHHMERLIDVAKDHGISMGETATSVAQQTTEHVTSTATTAAADTATSTVAQAAGEAAVNAAKDLPPTESGKGLKIALEVLGGAVLTGGVLGASYYKIQNYRENKARENEENKEGAIKLNELMEDIDDRDDVATPPSTNNEVGGGGPEGSTNEKPKRKGLLEILNSPIKQIRKELGETKGLKELIKLLQQLEEPLKSVFGPNFVLKFSKQSPAEEYLKKENVEKLKELVDFLEAQGPELSTRGINKVSIKLKGSSEITKDSTGDKVLRVSLNESLGNIPGTIHKYHTETAPEEMRKDRLIQEAKMRGIKDPENINRWVNLMNREGTGPLWNAYDQEMVDRIQDQLYSQWTWDKPRNWEPVVNLFKELIEDFNKEPSNSKIHFLNELAQLAPEAKQQALKSLEKNKAVDFENALKAESIKGALDKIYNDKLLTATQLNKIQNIINNKPQDYRKTENQQVLIDSYSALYEGLAKHPDRSSVFGFVIGELKKHDNNKIENLVYTSRLSGAGKDAYDKLKTSQSRAWFRRNKNK